MSFSNDVRREICLAVSDNDKRFACLYGILLFCRTLSPEHICFQTESSVSAEFFGKLFRKVFRYSPECRENSRKNTVLYCYDIYDRNIIREVYRTYRFINVRTINSEIIVTNSIGGFTAGIFLACGSVNNPSKEYHLEFSVPCGLLAEELTVLLADIGVTAKTTIRRGQPIVYIKDSESIEDTLTFMGAQNCTLEIMNVKIYKDVRNKANRIANCDSANIDKVVKASMRQIEDIKLIADNDGLESLTAELREVALMRLENTEMSLQEIGENLSVPISRSGVNHRFRKIAVIAENIRKEIHS
ncbi:MAG: DNA-binding protein WhiA [Ruminococcus sp.]|nr:DNA-binding protein WhiA [Ruminococcus sp.]MDE6679684.1 DNA-binding protein WhiA [Ruminococcus sp.]